MKKLYANPLIKVSEFDTEDIVTTSNTTTNTNEVKNNLNLSLDERLADAKVQEIILTW